MTLVTNGVGISLAPTNYHYHFLDKTKCHYLGCNDFIGHMKGIQYGKQGRTKSQWEYMLKSGKDML